VEKTMVSNSAMPQRSADVSLAPPSSRRSLLVNLLKYGLGLGLLAFVVAYNWSPNDKNGLAAAWQKYVIERQPLNYLPLLVAACICVPAVLLTYVRWYFLVRAQDLPFTLRSAVRLGLIGSALNTLLPGSIGGDVVKATCIAREQSRRTVAVATVLIDRAVGLWGLIWLVALLGGGFWAMGRLQGGSERILHTIVLGATGLVAATVLAWVLLGILPQHRADRFARRLEGIPRIGHSATEFWRAICVYRCKGWSIALALGLSLVGHVGFVFMFYFAAQTVGTRQDIPTVAEHFLTIPIGMTIEAGVPTPGGIGFGEGAYGTLYEFMGKPAVYGSLGCFFKRIIYWCIALIGYLVYVRMPYISPEEAFGITH
jgi:glycosyltransferase 2 family protein